jgi:TusA-related sulfurtransferase
VNVAEFLPVAPGRGLSEAPALNQSQATVVDLSTSEDLCTDPLPLEQVRRAYAKLPAGGRLEVRSPVTEHAFAVRAWSRKHGITLVKDERIDGVNQLVLERGDATAPPG